MKAYIRRHIAIGWTKSRIEHTLAAQPGLGNAIFGVPGTHGFDLLAWLIPIGGIVLGAVGIAAAAWYWSRNRPSSKLLLAGPGLAPAIGRRIVDVLARVES